MVQVVGWDIGGANVKAAWLEMQGGQVERLRLASQPFEIWRDRDRLPAVLRETLGMLASTQAAPGESSSAPLMAVTMTAELSDIFATKREGVVFVLESLQACFPDSPAYALSLAGDFEPVREALAHPLDFAAANWLATALWFARQRLDCLLVDVGSTTTDILPVLDGQVRVSERTDLERLASGELVYTGVLRTNLAAIVQSAPVAGRTCRVASEYFAISGDVHLILGGLRPEEYTCPTPDGRPPSVQYARMRLARLVCADSEMLTEGQIDELARYIYARQVDQIVSGIDQVLSRLPALRGQPVVALGAGSFLAAAAAGRMGLAVQALAAEWGPGGSALAPCVAAARLLAESRDGERQ